MCRTTDYYHGYNYNHDRLRLKSFSLHIPQLSSPLYLPEFLTLVFLPRINGSPLDIDGTRVRPDSPSFLTLYRHRSNSSNGIAFSAKDNVTVSDGTTFEVHVGDHRLLKGVFRHEHENDNLDERNIGQWRVECKCVLDEEFVFVGVSDVEVYVAREGGGVMREKVDVAVKKKRKCSRMRFKGGLLEDIPECDVEGMDGGDGGCCCGGDEVDGGDEIMESEMEGVRWAVDVGIWVMCLGVGLIVSGASARKLWKRKLLV